tara:strand:+ start:1040 stop:1639 length:600 start_codon:yes stop_codon:yes gene_type:complete
MNDTIRVYDKALPDGWCDSLIKSFENLKENHSKINRNQCPQFTEMCINTHAKQYTSGLVQFVLRVYDKYIADVNTKFLPDFKSLEEFRLKRYIPNTGDRFDEHVDIKRLRTSKRALSFLFYLNTCDGDTVFTRQDLNITPKCGRVVVFNPTWEYPHKGLPPQTTNKYVLSTYLHYPDLSYMDDPTQVGPQTCHACGKRL